MQTRSLERPAGLLEALGSGGYLSPTEANAIAAHFYPKVYSSGDHFAPVGCSAQYLGFVEAGVLRVYVLSEEGEERTKYFLAEGSFVLALDSYLTGGVTACPIDASVAARVWQLPLARLEELLARHTGLRELVAWRVQEAFLSKLNENDYLRFGSAKANYLAFEARYPELCNRLPLKHIASYLQVTPQSLSRIRAEHRNRVTKR
ncbi:MAG: Crp/Fnr family transcriptional regulator [Bacteroidia bacterium]|nr:Crp/Fnr family transcriptional regulator [Bacteroidia bacterium]